MNQLCTYCVCKTPSVFNTTVISVGGAPLSQVSVHFTGNDAAQLATTQETGRVELTEFCADTQVTFTKPDYVSLTYDLGNMPDMVTLRRIGRLISSYTQMRGSKVVKNQ